MSHPMLQTQRFPFFPDNEEYWFEAKRAFGASSYGASEFGEVMATLNRITSGDDNGWYNEWNATAERIFAEAEAQRAAGHRVSARDGYLRATNYFRTSEFFLHGNHEDPRIYSAYQKSIAAYKLCCSLYDVPILPVEIPYENTTLPGYFHRVDESGTKRPLLILHTGFDGSAEEMHGEGARAGVERGWNVLVFDGPGQYGPIHRERLPFRPDWEKVVTPVVDFAPRPMHQPRSASQGAQCQRWLFVLRRRTLQGSTLNTPLPMDTSRCRDDRSADQPVAVQ